MIDIESRTQFLMSYHAVLFESSHIGCDGIECDVRKTKDDILIINHNPNIGELIIKDHTYEELNNYTTSLGYALPTLIETLKLVKDKILIDIELKEVGYEEKIVDEILSILKYPKSDSNIRDNVSPFKPLLHPKKVSMVGRVFFYSTDNNDNITLIQNFILFTY